MDISVIISTWNNCERLSITLNDLFRCFIPANLRWELVLVNNNCTDDTDRVAHDFAKKLPLVYIREPIQGISRARNSGLRKASGVLVIFIDDDMRPCSELIETYWSAYKEKPSGYFFGGPVFSEFEGVSPSKELLNLAPWSIKGLNLGSLERALDPNECFISNWSVSRSFLNETSGFDVKKGLNARKGRSLIGEETALMECLKIKGLIPWYLPSAKVFHYVPIAKGCLQHISTRWEAGGYEMASRYNKDFDGIRFMGVPRWMYKKAFFFWLKCIFERFRGKTEYRDYRLYRQMVGMINWYRDAAKFP